MIRPGVRKSLLLLAYFDSHHRGGVVVAGNHSIDFLEERIPPKQIDQQLWQSIPLPADKLSQQGRTLENVHRAKLARILRPSNALWQARASPVDR